MSPAFPPSENHNTAGSDYYADSELGAAFFDGMFIRADSIKYSGTDRVLPVLEEEQIFMCRQMSKRLKPGMSVLDVGTGSGVLGIWAARHGCKVLAIDINPHALSMATENANYNGVQICESIDSLMEGSICFLEKRFEKDFDQGKFDIVLLNPPYNPTYWNIKPAIHAEAGEDGQLAFNEQIQCVPNNLKKTGCCIVHHMSTVTNNNQITAFEKVREVFTKGCEILFARVLTEDIDTDAFLKGQYYKYLKKYSEDTNKYINSITSKYSHFSLLYFEIFFQNNSFNLSTIQEKYHETTATWENRISLHRDIVEHIEFPILDQHIRDLFIPGMPTLDTEENLDREVFLNKPDQDWHNSKLKIIDDFIQKEGLLKNLALLIVDTAPIHQSSDGSIQSLSHEAKVWLGESVSENDSSLGQSENQQKAKGILTEWLLNVKANHESTIATITHPTFTGLLSLSKWCSIYSSYSWQKQKGKKEKHTQELYTKLFEEHRKNYDSYSFHENFDNEITFSEVHTFSHSKLRKVNTNTVNDYYRVVKGLQYCFDKNIDFLHIFDMYENAQDEEKLNIKILCEKDLIYRIKTLHTFTDKTLLPYLGESLNFSIMISLPIGFYQQENGLRLSSKPERDKLLQSYRGGIWIYATSKCKDDLNECKISLSKLCELLWLLYMDKYTKDAVYHTSEYMAVRNRFAFGHEFTRLIAFIESGINYLSALQNLDGITRFTVKSFVTDIVKYVDLCVCPRYDTIENFHINDIIMQAKRIALIQSNSDFSCEIVKTNISKINRILEKQIIVMLSDDNVELIEETRLCFKKTILAGLSNAIFHLIKNTFSNLQDLLENESKTVEIWVKIEGGNQKSFLIYNQGRYVYDSQKTSLGTKAVMEILIAEYGEIDIETIELNDMDESFPQNCNLTRPVVKTSIIYKEDK